MSRLGNVILTRKTGSIPVGTLWDVDVHLVAQTVLESFIRVILIKEEETMTIRILEPISGNAKLMNLGSGAWFVIGETVWKKVRFPLSHEYQNSSQGIPCVDINTGDIHMFPREQEVIPADLNELVIQKKYGC